jgi:glycosyltransferase involved in cell wall biosynthesis
MTITVAVCAIAGEDHLARCLDAVLAQEGAGGFDVLVIADPHLPGMERIGQRFPTVRLIRNEGQATPIEIASRALREATGDVIVLTEDHCTPAPGWLKRIVAAHREGRAAVGGAVQTSHSGDPVTWAFYLVDYYRYMRPFPEGPAPALTVCNVSYRREHLEAVRGLWRETFHETAVNAALAERFGVLWIMPDAVVTTRRAVRFGDAVYERYAFGRMFACNRNAFGGSTGRRVLYAVLAPLLPPVIMWRMGRRAFRSGAAGGMYLRALLPLVAMVLAWTWGEWLGYLTNRLPASVNAAPEIRASQAPGGLAPNSGE